MTDIAKEYGTALFMLACENGAKKEYARALETVKAVFDSNPEYLTFLSSPSISLGERLSAIEAAFEEKIPEHIVSYLSLLCQKGRITCFYESAEEYSALLNASEHISNAKVTSAVQLTDEEKQKLKNKLESVYRGEVNIEYFIDETLIGGLIVDVDGKIMDGSLRSRLHDVKGVMNT